MGGLWSGYGWLMSASTPRLVRIGKPVVSDQWTVFSQKLPMAAVRQDFGPSTTIFDRIPGFWQNSPDLIG